MTLLLPPASPALLAHGPWRAPLQQVLRPRTVFEEPPIVAPTQVARTSKKGARRTVASRLAIMQLDLIADPYTMAEWLRLPPLREGPAAQEPRAPLAERALIKKKQQPQRKRLTRVEIDERFQIRAQRMPVRPATRSGCADVPRPCPFVSCRHHLYLDVNPENGAIVLTFPGLEPWELTETCSLDVADHVEASERPMEMIPLSRLLNLTVQRVGQIRDAALIEARTKAIAAVPELADQVEAAGLLDEDP